MHSVGFLGFFYAFLNKPIHKIFYFLSGVFPRDKNLWLVGAQKKSFSCNSKHLFIAMQDGLPEGVFCSWVTRDKGVFKSLSGAGLPVVYLPSIKGFWYCLRAAVYFINCDVKDVSFYCSRGAYIFNLWHGIPLKKIQYDNPLNDRNVLKRFVSDGGVWRRFFFPFEAVRSTRVLSASDYVTDYAMISAFGVDKSSCLAFGYPRTDLFFLSPRELEFYNGKVPDKELGEISFWAGNFSRTIIYMPTWRDTKVNFLSAAGFDFSAMQAVLAEMNACLLLKLHPYTKIDLSDLSACPNIRLVPRSLDVYPLLVFVDTLITDYSSIYFDFLLLDREIIFFSFDYDEYLNTCRDMYLDYNSVTPGQKVYDFKTLLKELRTPSADFKSERSIVRNKFWGTYKGGASKEIIAYVYRETRG